MEGHVRVEGCSTGLSRHIGVRMCGLAYVYVCMCVCVYVCMCVCVCVFAGATLPLQVHQSPCGALSILLLWQASSDMLSALWDVLREAVCASDSKLVCMYFLWCSSRAAEGGVKRLMNEIPSTVHRLVLPLCAGCCIAPPVGVCPQTLPGGAGGVAVAGQGTP